MTLNDYVSPGRCMVLDTADKRTALAALAEQVALDLPGIAGQAVLDAVLEREEAMSTRIAPGLAMPHARLSQTDRTLAAVLVSQQGIAYDPSDEGRVHAVVMIVGGEEGHLQALAAVAERFQDSAMLDRLRLCRSGSDVFQVLSGSVPATDGVAQLDGPSRILIRQGLALAQEVAAGAILVYTDIPIERDASVMEPFDRPLVRVCSRSAVSASFPSEDARAQRLEFPFSGANPQSRMDLTLLLALARGCIRQGDRVVNVLGFANPSSLDTLVLSDADRTYRFFFSESGNDEFSDMDQSVLIRALQVATELACEGREGKAVGALFVVGDDQAVLAHAQQMVMNPFRGYEESERNIMDPGLTETIKEFSHIDGAIIVRGDGVILSAGAYLRSKAPVEGLPSGLGARHVAAAGISAATRALAIAISESTRQISLFRFGKRIMTL